MRIDRGDMTLAYMEVMELKLPCDIETHDLLDAGI
ncbi:hypothetical protein SOVF_082900 [Spinacia oleracea]|nr:hypothetical protein SOVF_082900 [Spinacia oleracea]